jgi:hypothetical protein
MEITNSSPFCLMSTNKGSFDTDAYGCIFSFVLCLKHFFPMPFIPKPPCYTWRTAADHSLINTALEQEPLEQTSKTCTDRHAVRQQDVNI